MAKTKGRRTIRLPAPPPGYEQIGEPSITVKTETTFYPKVDAPKEKGRAPKVTRKAEPMPVRVVSISNRARLGRR